MFWPSPPQNEWLERSECIKSPRQPSEFDVLPEPIRSSRLSFRKGQIQSRPALPRQRRCTLGAVCDCVENIERSCLRKHRLQYNSGEGDLLSRYNIRRHPRHVRWVQIEIRPELSKQCRSSLSSASNLFDNSERSYSWVPWLGKRDSLSRSNIRRHSRRSNDRMFRISTDGAETFHRPMRNSSPSTCSMDTAPMRVQIVLHE